MKRAVPILAAILALGLFAWLAWGAGPAEIWASLRSLGWLALLVPVPQLIAYLFDTLGWRSAFGRRPGIPSLWKLYWIRMAGEAVNVLTPSAYVAGEPIKAYLLSRCGVQGTVAAASVVVAKTLMTVAQVIFLLLGTLCAVGTVEGGNGLYLGLGVTILAGAAGTALLLSIQKRGFFKGLASLGRRVGIRLRALEASEGKLERLDEELRRFYREEPRAFQAGVAWHLAGWVLGAGEVYFCARWLGAPLSVLDAVAIEAFASVIKGATLFVPGSLGFQETGFVFLFRLFGLSDGSAVAFGLLRRARELFCAALGGGFVWLITLDPAWRKEIGASAGGKA